jgi:hypothetical protein
VVLLLKEYSVKELADLLEKHEETIKRWVRSGKLPNSYRNSDKEGWRIIESDLLKLNIVVTTNKPQELQDKTTPTNDEIGLIKLAYEAVTLTYPTEEILSTLSGVGIKRTLEILLIMQQSATKVKNTDGFINKAIKENWTPNTTPINIPRKKSKRVYDLTPREYEERFGTEAKQKPSVSLYNWLED